MACFPGPLEPSSGAFSKLLFLRKSCSRQFRCSPQYSSFFHTCLVPKLPLGFYLLNSRYKICNSCLLLHYKWPSSLNSRHLLSFSFFESETYSLAEWLCFRVFPKAFEGVDWGWNHLRIWLRGFFGKLLYKAITSLGPSLTVGRRHQDHVKRAAHNTAAGFPQSNQVRGQERTRKMEATVFLKHNLKSHIPLLLLSFICQKRISRSRVY